MREHADHHDAELLLRLYELRREEKLRRAREWFMREFHTESWEDGQRRYPRGSEGDAFFRMVTSYWEMACSVVNRGLIQEDFFFENTAEFWIVWQKVKHLAPAMRQTFQNPLYWHNLETACGRYENWMAGRAPQALESLAERLRQAPPQKSS
jgi:hypothetical protein